MLEKYFGSLDKTSDNNPLQSGIITSENKKFLNTQNTSTEIQKSQESETKGQQSYLALTKLGMGKNEHNFHTATNTSLPNELKTAVRNTKKEQKGSKKTSKYVKIDKLAKQVNFQNELLFR